MLVKPALRGLFCGVPIRALGAVGVSFRYPPAGAGGQLSSGDILGSHSQRADGIGMLSGVFPGGRHAIFSA